jgi:hypothetical protein
MGDPSAGWGTVVTSVVRRGGGSDPHVWHTGAVAGTLARSVAGNGPHSISSRRPCRICQAAEPHRSAPDPAITGPNSYTCSSLPNSRRRTGRAGPQLAGSVVHAGLDLAADKTTRREVSPYPVFLSQRR